MTDFFTTVPEPIRFEGPESDNPLAFRWYDADRVVGEKTMAEHLRMAVCYWHSFNWPGNDVFGDGTFDRPWLAADLEPMEAARTKMTAAFEFFEKVILTTEYLLNESDCKKKVNAILRVANIRNSK